MSEIDITRVAVTDIAMRLAPADDTLCGQAAKALLALRDALDKAERERDDQRKSAYAWQQVSIQNGHRAEQAERERDEALEALREIDEHCDNDGRGNTIVDDRTLDRIEEITSAILAKHGGDHD